MAVPLRITTVGMSPTDAAALRAAVGASPRRDVASVVAAEMSGAVDAVVADAGLPEDELRKLLAGAEAPPVVLLAGIDEGWIVARMLRAGAFDWIDRSRVLEDAARVVRRAFERCESERRRRSANVMLEQVASEQARLVQEGTNRWLKVRDALDREVASHRRAQSQLAIERTLLRTVVDNLPDLVYAKDLESRFVLANRAVAELMGAESPDDVAGRSDLDYYPALVERAARSAHPSWEPAPRLARLDAALAISLPVLDGIPP
ncbi:hypothetical protein LBMAG53_21390 [Planctomycetota bacterium]|nr:hypothetical protein LBMAG53_21390 [Planctomycetota bacterium]